MTTIPYLIMTSILPNSLSSYRDALSKACSNSNDVEESGSSILYYLLSTNVKIPLLSRMPLGITKDSYDLDSRRTIDDAYATLLASTSLMHRAIAESNATSISPRVLTILDRSLSRQRRYYISGACALIVANVYNASGVMR